MEEMYGGAPYIQLNVETHQSSVYTFNIKAFTKVCLNFVGLTLN